MSPDSSSFTALNVPTPPVLPQCMNTFVLSAPPNTDLWRKPPCRDTATAPILYTSMRFPFVAAEVTVSANWELEWDQAGLVIFAGAPPTGQSAQRTSITAATTTAATITPAPAGTGTAPPTYVASQPPPASKWVKAGLEFYNNRPHASSVCATSDGADWALAPLSNAYATRSDLRVKLERVGYALWIWFEDSSTIAGGWKKLREVTWFFWGVEDKAIRVGVYASRPANFGISNYERRNGGPGVAQRALDVEFEGLEIF